MDGTKRWDKRWDKTIVRKRRRFFKPVANAEFRFQVEGG